MNDTDALLTFGQISFKRSDYARAEGTYAVVNSIYIKEDCGIKTYTANVSIYGIDSYSWQKDDRANKNKEEFRASGIDPGVFEYVWLAQEYGYGQPFTMTFGIDEKEVSGSVKSNSDCPPKKLPTPPTTPTPSNGSGGSKTNVVASRDPNDIIGPQGFGEEHWVTAADPLAYTIRFENDPVFATAPAQTVRVTQQLDSDLDFRTFRVGDFGFGDTFIDVPDNRAFYQTRLDLTATQGIYVDVAAGIDITKGEAFWEFTSIDPATGEIPADPLRGFLLPNLTPPEGDGFVSYTVRPKSTLATGATIDAQARIIFDINEPIDTPAIKNTIDAGKPTSAVEALPTTVADTSFPVKWSGNDDAIGSALAGYTIYISENGGEFTPWLEDTTLTEATYIGQPGSTYAFYSIARDNAGNVEAVPNTPDTQIAVIDTTVNPSILDFSATLFSLNEDGTLITAVTINRTGSSVGAIATTVSLTDGTATSPTDYDSTPIAVNFADGEVTKTITVPAVNDTAVESNETIALTLTNPTGGAVIGTQNTATLAIVDDDVSLAFSAAQFSVNEDGTPIAAVTITRTGRTTGEISALVNLQNGTATSPADYNSTPIVVNFADGEITKTITVPVVNDTAVESNETIALTLTNPTGGAVIGTQNTATLAIVDDDVSLAFSAAQFSVNEDGTPIAAVTITRTGRTTGEISARVNLQNGTATSPADYNNTPIVVNFAPGETTQTVTIPIVDDTLGETNETVNLTLSDPTGGATIVTQNTATLTIVENDVQLAFHSTPFTVREDGTPLYAVRVARTGKTTVEVGATIILSDGTATAPNDYNNSPITVRLASGETQKTVIVPIVEDTIVESRETIALELRNPTGGATIGAQNTTTVNIVDNETPPSGLTIVGTNNGDTLTGQSTNDALYGGNGNDSLFGGAGDDSLDGGGGNDTLDGGAGNDELVGGLGNDVYIVDSTGDITVDVLNGGTEIVRSAVDWTLGDNLENLVLTQSNPIKGTGNALRNVITGNSGNNSLSGGDSSDTLTGGEGNDTLNGGNGNDVLQGEVGNDVLAGNLGYDSLTGGDGNDRFVYSVFDERGDTIVDFNTSNDVIVLTELFANVGYKGTDPFIDRYLGLVQSGANTQVQIDPNGTAGAPGFSTLVTLNNVVSTSLNANNFVF
ncbi:calcium-binding protein [Argonema antarcticum]|uniref:calcium-binding protein n=1 Tax=Argonema antarcticum TaxID=2942763 RepID=UPI00201133F8|nr:calcium-binding protein [Argonema antarcticum]MCL1475466.1 hypothetical protein [Argonema antarcticum A004/B2]